MHWEQSSTCNWDLRKVSSHIVDMEVAVSTSAESHCYCDSFIEQNRTAWVEKDLKGHLVSTPPAPGRVANH